MAAHDIVVIGTSTGGVDTLCSLVSDLPKDFAGAVLVVMHVGKVSMLPEILTRSGLLPATAAKHLETIRAGHIYVAPPGRHMIVRGGHIALTRQAMENRHRPAIDPLFRSAARVYRRRVVGVILSGALDDGMAGLFTVKNRGGLAVVQDPEDAVMPTMPVNALRYIHADHCLPVAAMGALLSKLVGRSKSQNGHALKKPAVRAPARGIEKAEGLNGRQVPFSCPDCQGPMFMHEEGGIVHFHCNVGHSYSADTLSDAHAEALERAIWIAIRSLRERSAIQRSLASGNGKVNKEIAKRLKANVKAADRDTVLLREILERI